MNTNLPVRPKELNISEVIQNKIRETTLRLAEKYQTIDNPEFLTMMPYEAATGLPKELYKELRVFSESYGQNDYGALILKKFWNTEKMGVTPSRWQEVNRCGETHLMEFAFALIHSALGSRVMQYSCQRGGGGFCHSVIPDENLIATYTGAGSKEPLLMHTEDSGLKTGAEYISLFWIRNLEQVPSYLFSVRSLLNSGKPELLETLKKPIFRFYPDVNVTYKKSLAEFLDKNKMAVLFGNELAPFIRFDIVDMLGRQDSSKAEEALQELQTYIQTNTQKELVPTSGDFVLLNNRMCAHGRGSFQAGIDPAGNQVDRRWMLRMMSHTSAIETHEFTSTNTRFLNEEVLLGHKYEVLEKYVVG